MDRRTAQLHATLRRLRVARASDLMAELGISQPTLARTIRRLGPSVAAIGRGRRTSYAAVRSVRGLPLELPVFRVDATGRPSRVANLRVLEPAGAYLEPPGALGWPLEESMRDGLFPGLPYFLVDMRPQGFLGRAFAREHSVQLRLPENPDRWSDDEVLTALANVGADMPGELIVGEISLDAFQRLRAGPGDWLPATTRASAYPSLAMAALAGEAPGSSAGGEFAKFTTAIEDERRVTHVIVKFSPADDTPASRRWSDLLIAEHHAAAALESIEVAAARSELLAAEGRTFLEVTRFDRVGAYGRRAVVTLASVEPALLGLGEARWEKAASELHRHGWLSAEDASRVAKLSSFGRLIGNSDMHAGNLAFMQARDATLASAPAYDMLPMLFAPTRAGELVRRELTPAPPPPGYEEEWHAALSAALRYWAAVGDDARLSDDFRPVCEDGLARLRGLAQRFS